MTGIQVSRYKIAGADCLIVAFDGVMDTTNLDNLTQETRQAIPPDFDGYLIIDVRNLDDKLANNDVDLLFQHISQLRYIFRKPTAVLVDHSKSVSHSRNFFHAHGERDGLVFRDFDDLSDAVDWLKDPDGD